MSDTARISPAADLIEVVEGRAKVYVERGMDPQHAASEATETFIAGMAHGMRQLEEMAGRC